MVSPGTSTEHPVPLLLFPPSLARYRHANPACFTLRETERLIVIPRGSADLSQICLPAPAPHSHLIPTSFPHRSRVARNPWNRRNSLVAAMCRRCGKFVSAGLVFPPTPHPPAPPLPHQHPGGNSSPELRENSEQRRRRRETEG